MAECEKTPKCQFYCDRMEDMPPSSPAMKQRFCLSDKDACARYQLSTAGRAVPPDLFPDMIDRARRLMSD